MITRETNWGQFVRNGSCLVFLSRQLLTDCILGESEKEKKRKLRYRIHECSTQKHSCILNHLLWVKVLSTKCMKRLLRQQIYLHTFVHVNSSEVNTHMQTYSPQCTIHWVAIFVHTSRASLLTILFGKFCICVQIQDTDTLHFTKTMFSLQVFLAEDKWQYYGILKWGDGRLKGLLKDICLIALSNLDLVPLFFGTREKTGDPT